MCVIHQPWPSNTTIIAANSQCSSRAGQPQLSAVLRTKAYLLEQIIRAEKSIPMRQTCQLLLQSRQLTLL
jgi:hypothetical protein